MPVSSELCNHLWASRERRVEPPQKDCSSLFIAKAVKCIDTRTSPGNGTKWVIDSESPLISEKISTTALPTAMPSCVLIRAARDSEKRNLFLTPLQRSLFREEVFPLIILREPGIRTMAILVVTKLSHGITQTLLLPNPEPRTISSG